MTAFPRTMISPIASPSCGISCPSSSTTRSSPDVSTSNIGLWPYGVAVRISQSWMAWTRAVRTLFAQQLLFRSGELLEFVFADLRIFQIEVGECVDHRRSDDNAGIRRTYLFLGVALPQN